MRTGLNAFEVSSKECIDLVNDEGKIEWKMIRKRGPEMVTVDSNPKRK